MEEAPENSKESSNSAHANGINELIKTAPTCFGAVTPSSGSTLFMIAKVTVIKIVNHGTSVCA